MGQDPYPNYFRTSHPQYRWSALWTDVWYERQWIYADVYTAIASGITDELVMKRLMSLH